MVGVEWGVRVKSVSRPHSYPIIGKQHLEGAPLVVGEHATVEEVLGESHVHHAVVLSHDRVHGVVGQSVVLIFQVIEHALCGIEV